MSATNKVLEKKKGATKRMDHDIKEILKLSSHGKIKHTDEIPWRFDMLNQECRSKRRPQFTKFLVGWTILFFSVIPSILFRSENHRLVLGGYIEAIIDNNSVQSRKLNLRAPLVSNNEGQSLSFHQAQSSLNKYRYDTMMVLNKANQNTPAIAETSDNLHERRVEQNKHRQLSPKAAYSCVNDGDCAIKEAGSCCGMTLDCFNSAFIPIVSKECQKASGMDHCIHKDIVNCICRFGICEGLSQGDQPRLHISPPHI